MKGNNRYAKQTKILPEKKRGVIKLLTSSIESSENIIDRETKKIEAWKTVLALVNAQTIHLEKKDAKPKPVKKYQKEDKSAIIAFIKRILTTEDRPLTSSELIKFINEDIDSNSMLDFDREKFRKRLLPYLMNNDFIYPIQNFNSDIKIKYAFTLKTWWDGDTLKGKYQAKLDKMYEENSRVREY